MDVVLDCLPAGYYRFMELAPRASKGFGAAYDRATVLFRWRYAGPDERNGLLLFVAAANDEPLIETDRREGVPIDLGLSGVHALYHDGVWSMHPHDDPTTVPRFYWNTGNAHSLTVRGRATAYGIRGMRRQRVGLHELVEIARRLPH
jgi:hypothetical protein